MEYKAFLRKYAILGITLGLYPALSAMEASSPFLRQIKQNTTSLLKRSVKQVCYELHYLERNYHEEVVKIGFLLPLIFAIGAISMTNAYQSPINGFETALQHGNTLAMAATSLMHILAQEPGWAVASIGVRCTSEAIAHYNSHIPLTRVRVALCNMAAQGALSLTRILCNDFYRKQPHYRNGNGCVLTRAVDQLKTWADTTT